MCELFGLSAWIGTTCNCGDVVGSVHGALPLTI
jgi:hypothetical protein